MKSSCKTGLLIFLFLFCSGFAQAQIISTYAGDTSSTYAGDGGPATNAKFCLTTGVAVDAAGNVFIADQGNNRIRKVSTAGIVTTIAGTGVSSFSGDGGPATAAKLNRPVGLTIDGLGNIYVADYINCRVRKINAAGIISTVAGSTLVGYAGDGGAATAAKLYQPTGVAVDASGNIYIADQSNQRIRRVNTSGNISTVAGNGIAGYGGDGGPATAAMLHHPTGITVDAAGNIFIADQSNSSIRKVDAAGIITTIVGNGILGYSGDGGPATVAQLYQPSGICLDGAGNIFVADMSNDRVRKIDATGIITTVSGIGTEGLSGDGGPATAAQLYNPFSVAIDGSGNLLIADHTNNRIRRMSTAGIINTIAGSGTIAFGDGGPATAAQLRRPQDMTIDRSNNIYFTDASHHTVKKITPSGLISTIAGNGFLGYNGDYIPATGASLNYPSSVAVDTSGNLYIADAQNRRIRKVNTLGIITTICGNGLSGSPGALGDGGPATNALVPASSSIVVDIAGNIYFSDYNHLIRRIDTAGIVTKIAGSYGSYGSAGDGGPATACSLNYLCGMKMDNLGNLYIADVYNRVVRSIDTSGIIRKVAGTGVAGYSGDGGPATAAQLNLSCYVAINSLGNLIISDATQNRIRLVNASGIITTIAGNGSAGYTGDGGMATAATINSPQGMCEDTYGNLYIADTYNNVIRRVSGSPTLGVVNTNHHHAKLFPNPTTAKIEVTSTETITNLKVYNLMGMQVYEQACNSLTATVDISILPAGIYLLKVNDAAVYKVEKE